MNLFIIYFICYKMLKCNKYARYIINITYIYIIHIYKIIYNFI